MRIFFCVNTNTLFNQLYYWRKNSFLNSMLLIIYNNEQFTFLSFRMLNINNKDVLGSANIIENMPKH